MFNQYFQLIFVLCFGAIVIILGHRLECLMQHATFDEGCLLLEHYLCIFTSYIDCIGNEILFNHSYTVSR